MKNIGFLLFSLLFIACQKNNSPTIAGKYAGITYYWDSVNNYQDSASIFNDTITISLTSNGHVMPQQYNSWSLNAPVNASNSYDMASSTTGQGNRGTIDIIFSPGNDSIYFNSYLFSYSAQNYGSAGSPVLYPYASRYIFKGRKYSN